MTIPLHTDPLDYESEGESVPETPQVSAPTPIVPQKEYIDYKARDLDLFHAWKKTGDKRDLSNLVKQLHPVIYSEVRRVSGTLPEAALSAEAKHWTIRALQTFDPSRGVALSTHVMNYLPKVRRLNYKYQNAARLPENLHLQYTEFQNSVSHLQNTLNREPTDEEIAKHIGWSKPLVVKFKNSLYEDLVESANLKPLETAQFNTNKLLLDHIMDKLTDQEKMLLNLKGTMPASELAAKLGVNISRLNYLNTKLKDKIAGIKAEINMY